MTPKLNQHLLPFLLKQLRCIGSLLGLSLLLSSSVCAQKSDSERMTEQLEEYADDFSEAEASPNAVTVEDGAVQFYLIEAVKGKRPDLYVQTEGEFQTIRPSFGAKGPLHQLEAAAQILFYEKVAVERDGATFWEHIPRYSLSLQGYGGGEAVVFLPPRKAGSDNAQSSVQRLRWVELSTAFCDFGEVALVNSFDRPMAIQMDGKNAMLNPGQSQKNRFKLWRKQTGVVHLRVAMGAKAGNYQELFNRGIFIFEDWRGILIPYYDAILGELQFIEIKESPPVQGW